jgi:hypothetical protein
MKPNALYAIGWRGFQHDPELPRGLFARLASYAIMAGMRTLAEPA